MREPYCGGRRVNNVFIRNEALLQKWEMEIKERLSELTFGGSIFKRLRSGEGNLVLSCFSLFERNLCIPLILFYLLRQQSEDEGEGIRNWESSSEKLEAIANTRI